MRQVNASPMKARSRWFCEAEVVEGLAEFGKQELRELFGQQVIFNRTTSEMLDSFRFVFDGDLRKLVGLRCIEAVYLIRQYAIPRPKGLLGDANWRVFREQIETVMGLWPGQFHSFYLAAAGSGSRVMGRIREQIAVMTQLNPVDERGDLLIRIVPALKANGWETRIRLTPRPLSARSWRICNYEGALNATAARAMALMTKVPDGRTWLNLACGSGTIAIEAAEVMGNASLLALDRAERPLHCALQNYAAAEPPLKISFIRGDASALPLPTHSVDGLCADLPFGQRVGSPEENRMLYPLVLMEAGRVARRGARFALLTHQIRLIEMLLNEQSLWRVERIVRLNLRGLHPRLYILVRC